MAKRAQPSTAMPDPADEPVISVERAAAVLGVQRSTAYAAVKSGALPSIRLSAKRVVIPTHAFVALVRDGTPMAS